MFGDPYATAEDLATFMQRDLSAAETATATDALDAASRVVEDFCGRQFNKDTGEDPVASARRFLAVDPQRLPVDDFHTTTDLEVEVNGTAWDVADVDPRPFNGVYEGVSGWPYFDLLTVSKTWPSGRRPKVTITAHWGWAAVPVAIQQATLEVAAGIFTESGGAVRAETLGTYSVSYSVPGGAATDTSPPELAKAAPYRRLRFGVG